MTTSGIHQKNANTIDILEDKSLINERKTTILRWVNDLEELARDVVSHFNNNEKEELDLVFGVAENYRKNPIKYASAREEVKELAEFGISRYNAILRNGKVSEDYMLGRQIS